MMIDAAERALLQQMEARRRRQAKRLEFIQTRFGSKLPDDRAIRWTLNEIRILDLAECGAPLIPEDEASMPSTVDALIRLSGVAFQIAVEVVELFMKDDLTGQLEIADALAAKRARLLPSH